MAFFDCVDCGVVFCSRHALPAKRCAACRLAVAKRKNNLNARRRKAKIKLVTVEVVNLLRLAERDGWRCHLCGKVVPKRVKYPHPKSATVGHIVPVSLGGEESYVNTALAHFACNVAKSNRAVGDQLRLIG